MRELPPGYPSTHTAPGLDISFKIQIENSQRALANRAKLDAARLCCVNIISSLGVGATSLIERTVAALQSELRIAVIEGDTILDLHAERLQAHGAPVVDLTSARTPHMNADLLADGLGFLERDGSLDQLDLLLVEHIGDLICPAVFALGEHVRVVVVDVDEDADKPLKHPLLFHCANCIVINKLDLVPDGSHSPERLIANIRTVNPHVPIITLSAETGQDVDHWLDWLRAQVHQFVA